MTVIPPSVAGELHYYVDDSSNSKSPTLVSIVPVYFDTNKGVTETTIQILGSVNAIAEVEDGVFWYTDNQGRKVTIRMKGFPFVEAAEIQQLVRANNIVNVMGFKLPPIRYDRLQSVNPERPLKKDAKPLGIILRGFIFASMGGGLSWLILQNDSITGGQQIVFQAISAIFVITGVFLIVRAIKTLLKS